MPIKALVLQVPRLFFCSFRSHLLAVLDGFRPIFFAGFLAGLRKISVSFSADNYLIKKHLHTAIGKQVFFI